MLKFKEISNSENIYNESDYYIKIKIIFGIRDSIKNRLFYWSTLGPKQSLIEIGTKKHNGAIYEVTVITMPTLCTNALPTSNKNIIKKIGLPLFETNAWEEENNTPHYIQGYYIRENKDFEVYANEKNVSIVFSHNNNVVLHVINDPIIFGFDSNNLLCFIRMENMTLDNERVLIFSKNCLKKAII